MKEKKTKTVVGLFSPRDAYHLSTYLRGTEVVQHTLQKWDDNWFHGHLELANGRQLTVFEVRLAEVPA